MKIHHLRSATMVIESGSHFILVDPMLGGVGTLPSFSYFRHRSQRNPLVPLPPEAGDLLPKVTHCLITHSQKLGIRALQHTDHLDRAGERFLRKNGIPITTRRKDAPYLRKIGLRVVGELEPWQPAPLLEGQITAVPARHGHGWNHRLMANGVGYHLELPDEPSIYISGDTVYTSQVERALRELKPDVAVMASGSASMDIGKPILMTLPELIEFTRTAPRKVIANHLEALNHCPTTRSELKVELEKQGLGSKVMIPEDGETLDLTIKGAA